MHAKAEVEMFSGTKSWLSISPESHFSLANIPFGIISTPTNSKPRPAVAIGDHALDLSLFAQNNGFSAAPGIEADIQIFSDETLNAFAAKGQSFHREVRMYLQAIFTDDTPHPTILKTNEKLKSEALIALKDVQTHLPMEIGDYTDFFAGKNHAFNVGTLFRGPENALNSNYLHLPVAYHGRASSVVVSGTSLKRPWGQTLSDPKAEPKVPNFTPCKRLDIELELGMFVCKGNALGEQIDVKSASRYIFGYVLMNDWSARDIQMWEYVPLGPFNAKNFGTTISAWVVLADALAPFVTKGMENFTPLHTYLQQDDVNNALDIALEIDITTSKGNTTTISRSNAKHLVWSWPQMLAHHTVSGCPMRPGDLLGSGTISGTEFQTQGSLLELSQGGKIPLKLEGAEERRFLEDGDVVTIRGWSGKGAGLVGFVN
ncbi:hypothetical protein BJ875DRAFT_521610 [Amylocarpus encephaloides]|uniref:Fumarylacetoacetase n=1 Tax=Amylocarpus encephaloides TaxID=45428 RepID=A0A9P7YA73_9HELO|nr:hypothetical protein BJ875DRAFT_521610 [Amylocarpus encephaloides]